ncbi:MAG TPA: glycosyltransferase family 87 protein [Terracidiphilus sp.]|nr:glycosyltransferase family 87 protein [Terracidiphilus sp.]
MYTAGYMVRTGHGAEIYDYGAEKAYQDRLVTRSAVPLPFIRPGYQALLFAPFSLLPFVPAYGTFLLLNVAALALFFRLLLPSIEGLTRKNPSLMGALPLYIPVTVALLQGQDSLWLLVLIAGGLQCLRGEKDFAAGALIALGLFKLQMIFPIFALFLFWRRIRFCAGFTCTGVALGAISVWVTGAEASRLYVKEMFGLGSSLGFASGPRLEINLMANLHGLISVLLQGTLYVLPATIAVSALLLMLLAIRRPRREDQLIVAVTCGALVSYYMYVHDMSVLLVPMLVVLQRLLGPDGGRYPLRGVHLAAIGAMWAMPAFLLIASKWMWLASVPLLVFCILIVLFPARGRSPQLAN